MTKPELEIKTRNITNRVVTKLKKNKLFLPILYLETPSGIKTIHVGFNDDKEKKILAKTIPFLVRKSQATVAYLISDSWKIDLTNGNRIGDCITIYASSPIGDISAMVGYSMGKNNRIIFEKPVVTENDWNRFFEGAFTEITDDFVA